MEVIDAYLFMKRFLAHGTDGEVTDDEWARIVEDLVDDTRELGLSDDDWQQALERNEAVYEAIFHIGEAAIVKHFRHCVETLKGLFDVMPDVRDRLVEQLWRLAEADGVVDWMEHHFIEEAARTWGSGVPTGPV